MLTHYCNSVCDWAVLGLQQGQATSFVFVIDQGLEPDAGFCMVMIPGAPRQSGMILQPAATRRIGPALQQWGSGT